jgi:phosphate uptake regulator
MDVRKLIGFGKGSFVISLPKNWVDANKLSKGALITVEESKAGLLLSPGSDATRKEENKITINVAHKDLPTIKSEIITAYLNDFDTIELLFKDLPKNGPKIKEIIRDLAGLEILEQTSHRLVAKDLLDINEISLQSIIRRMDLITRGMIEDTITCIEKKSDPDSVSQRDAEVNRLHFLAFRVIRKALSNPRYARAVNLAVANRLLTGYAS